MLKELLSSVIILVHHRGESVLYHDRVVCGSPPSIALLLAFLLFLVRYV